MDEREAARRLCEDGCLGIFGYIHGEPWILVDGQYVRDGLLQMGKENLRVTGTGIIFKWTWPWAENPLYNYSNYTRTWGFTPEEIVPPADPPAGDGEGSEQPDVDDAGEQTDGEPDATDEAEGDAE